MCTICPHFHIFTVPIDCPTACFLVVIAYYCIVKGIVNDLISRVNLSLFLIEYGSVGLSSLATQSALV